MTADVLWHGPVERELLHPISDFRPHPRNPRRGDVAAIARSLDRFGQMRAIVVQKSTGYVIAGNHTMRGAQQLGWTHIAAHVIDVDDHEALGYLLADNRLAELATYDESELASLLVEYREVDPDLLEVTGWDAEAVDGVLANLSDPSPGGGDGDGRLPQSGDRRETVLLMDASQHARFHERVSILAKEYGTDGVSETVYKAIAEAVKNR